jgi:hypothetical protein
MAEVVLASFEVLAWHFPGDTAENNKRPSTLDVWPPGYDIKLGHVEYNGILLTYLPQ